MELFKLGKKRAAILFGVVLLVLCKAALLAVHAPMSPDEKGSAFAYLAQSASMTMVLWWFLLLCLSAASISNERSRGILRMHLSRPVGRGAFLFARVGALLVVLFVLLLADAAVGVTLAAISRTFGDVADPALQGPQFAATSMALGVVRCYLFTFLGLAAALAMGLLFSVLIANPVTAIAWAAGTGLILEGVRRVFEIPMGAYVHYMPTQYIFIHFDQIKSLAYGFSISVPGSSYVLLSVLVPTAYFLTFIFLAYKALQRADIAE